MLERIFRPVWVVECDSYVNVNMIENITEEAKPKSIKNEDGKYYIGLFDNGILAFTSTSTDAKSLRVSARVGTFLLALGVVLDSAELETYAAGGTVLAKVLRNVCGGINRAFLKHCRVGIAKFKTKCTRKTSKENVYCAEQNRCQASDPDCWHWP
jgi:hypothetical protein